MTYRERVGSYLQSIAPLGASNREIAASLGIRWPGSVYRATRQLAQAGLIQREREGRRWVFSAGMQADELAQATTLPTPPEEIAPASPSAEHALQENWRREWLQPLLAQPEGCIWFLEKLRCPCTPDQARAAEVTYRRRPLRDLLERDYAACGGSVEAQENLARVYNALFSLPDDGGIRKVWRAERAGAMRLPLPGRDGAWTAKLLRKHIARKRNLKRALNVLRLVQTRVDAMILVGSHVVLVRCAQGDPITERQYGRHKALAGVLERRLGRRFFLAGVVDGPGQLGVLDLAHVRWAEIRAWLASRESAVSQA